MLCEELKEKKYKFSFQKYMFTNASSSLLFIWFIFWSNFSVTQTENSDTLKMILGISSPYEIVPVTHPMHGITR